MIFGEIQPQAVWLIIRCILFLMSTKERQKKMTQKPDAYEDFRDWPDDDEIFFVDDDPFWNDIDDDPFWDDDDALWDRR